MNIFTFTGHLGKDCEVRATTSGTATCEFSVAVTSGYKDNEKTTWTSCVIFGKRAEGKLPEHLTKGQKVAISGELTQETWQKTDGGTGFKLKVVVNSLDLIGVREQPAQQQPAPQQGYQTPQYQSQSPAQQQAPHAGGSPEPYMPSAAGTTAGGGQQAGQMVDLDSDIPFFNPYKNMEYLV